MGLIPQTSEWRSKLLTSQQRLKCPLYEDFVFHMFLNFMK